MTQHPTDRTGTSSLGWLVRVPIDPMTYRALAYLVVSMPLAILYVTAIVTGVALSVGFMILLVGPIVFAATLMVIIGFAWLDGVLAEIILDADVDPSFPTHENVRGFVKELFLGRGTWLSLLYLIWKILLGFAALIGVLAALSFGVSLLVAPVVYGDHVVFYTWGTTHAIDTLEAAIASAVLGTVVLFATLVAINALGVVSRGVAEGLLQHDESG